MKINYSFKAKYKVIIMYTRINSLLLLFLSVISLSAFGMDNEIPGLRNAVRNLNVNEVSNLVNQQGRQFSAQEYQYYAEPLRNIRSFNGDMFLVRFINDFAYHAAIQFGVVSAFMWLVTRKWKNFKPTLKLNKKSDLEYLYYLVLGIAGISGITAAGTHFYIKFAENRSASFNSIANILHNNRG